MRYSYGFTLLETVIAAGIALIVGTLLVSIWINHQGFSLKQNSLVSEGLSLNDATREIDETIRQANSVSEGYPQGSPLYLSGPEVLVLKLPALDVSGVINNVFDFAVVAKDTDQSSILRLQIFPDPQSIREPVNLVLTTILQSVAFNYFDQSGSPVAPALAVEVEASLEVMAKTGSIGSSRSSSVKVSLRNMP